MPRLPDFPGKGLVSGTSRRARMLAGGAVVGSVAAGGFVVRRVLGHGGDGGESANADPIAESPTAPPGSEGKPVPEPSGPARPETEKPKPAKPKAAKPKPKPAKPKAAKPRPKPPKPGSDAEKAAGKDPHHALNNPVGDPDPTEYPGPFEKREDPRDPIDPDALPFGEEPHPQTGAESTSEPPPSQDPEVGDRAKPPKRENLDG